MRGGRAFPVLAALLGLTAIFPARADSDAGLKLNQIQRIGTAESYKLAPGDSMLHLIRMGGKKNVQALDFGEPPLATQLDKGAGSLSFDIAYDPKGGLFKSPAGAAMADELLDKDFVAAMKQPGFKVIHVLDVDFKSSCLTLKACLSQVADWSHAHPGHLPIVITIAANEQKTPMPGATKPLPFDQQAAAALEGEIRAVFHPNEIITPAQVKAGHADLRQAVLAGAWPSLIDARSKIIFVLNEGPRKISPYPGALMFTAADENSPDAAFIALDDPIRNQARIAAAVRAGFMVITRADAETREARAHDTRRLDAALASGAQIIQTNFLLPDNRIGPYQAQIGGRRHARCDTLNADCKTWNAAMVRTATAN